MTTTKELIVAQILAVDDSSVEALLQQVYQASTLRLTNSIRMTPSFEDNNFTVRLDILSANGEFVTTIRVPLNGVPLLKQALHRAGELEQFMVDITERFNKMAQDAIASAEKVIFHS